MIIFKKTYFSSFCMLVSVSLLSSCSFLSPVSVELPTKYVLDKPALNVPTKKMHQAILLVADTDARPIYNTKQMAYSDKAYEIAYFSQNEWAETPAQMLQSLLVQAMQSTHYFKSIITPPATTRYDYALNTSILELQQDFTQASPVLHMSVRAQLTRMSTNTVIATQQFSINEPMLERSPVGGVKAANLATAKILQAIASFCLMHMR